MELNNKIEIKETNMVDFDECLEDDIYKEMKFYTIITPDGKILSGMRTKNIDKLAKEYKVSFDEPLSPFLTRSVLNTLRENGFTVAEDIKTPYLLDKISENIKLEEDIEDFYEELYDHILERILLMEVAESLGIDIFDATDEVIDQIAEEFDEDCDEDEDEEDFLYDLLKLLKELEELD